jgi:hypothetical protein
MIILPSLSNIFFHTIPEIRKKSDEIIFNTNEVLKSSMLFKI